MRLLMAAVLIVLLSWLYRAWISNSTFDKHAIPCEEFSASDTAVYLLLSPLSMYSILTSTLVRLVVAAPTLIFSALRHTVLLLVATPACMLSLFVSAMLTCILVGMYLLHIALVGGVAVWTLVQHPSDVVHEKVKFQKKRQI
ncbi:uncharacterized protein LOC144198426 [Stigmatopora nigra]